MMTGRYPLAFLRLEMPVDGVDVNVHPAKLEVRFQDGGRLYSQILGTIRNKFLTTDLTAKAQLTRPAAGEVDPTEHNFHQTSTSQRQVPLDWKAVPPRRDFPGVSGSTLLERSQEIMPEGENASPFDNLPEFSRSEVQARQEGQAPDPSYASQVDTEQTLSTDARVLASASGSQHAVQIHNRYLVTENEEGMVVIDQHALHERVLYEKIRTQALSGPLETQQLLVPETVHLNPAEAALAEEHADVLEQIGLKIEHFGGNTLLIHSYPAMLAKRPPAEILRVALEQVVQGEKTPQKRDILDELLHMMSCKAAIKAGDRLSPEEIDSLLEYRDLCQDAHHCPHGRPTALVFSRDELDRRFKRI